MRTFRLSFALFVALTLCLFVTQGTAQTQSAQPQVKPSPASIELDTLISRFSRQELVCEDAVSAFHAYSKRNPGNALSLLYLARAYDRMGSFIGECNVDEKKTLLYEDSALVYFKQASAIDKNIRERANGFTMSQMLGHHFGTRAMYALYNRNGKAASDELSRGLAEGGYSDAMMQYARMTLASVDSNAILFSFGDDDTFPLWYEQLVQGYRRDVTLINASLLNTPWYQALIRKGIPGYVTAADFERIDGPKDKDIFYSNRQIIEYDSLRHLPGHVDLITLDPAVQTRIQNQTAGRVPATLAFTAFQQPASGDPGLTALTYEAMGRIVKANAWKRPVYFQQLGFSGFFNRIEPYLRMEGLVSQIFPDSGADYIPAKQEWLDTTKFLQSLDRVLASKEVLADPLTAQYISGTMVPELYLFAARAQTMADIQHIIEVGRPIEQSDTRNASWYYGELVLRLAEKGKVKSVPDLQWLGSALEAAIKQTPQGYLTPANAYYARTLAALGECSALSDYFKALDWAAKAPPNSPAAQYYSQISAAQSGCTK